MDLEDVNINQSEMEKTTTRRDCIANIIHILKVSSKSEKKENLKKIKKELEFEITFTSHVVIKKLKGILKNLDKEIKQLSTGGSPTKRMINKKPKTNIVQKYRMKKVEVTILNINNFYPNNIVKRKKKESKHDKEKKKFMEDQEKEMEKMRNLQVEPEKEDLIGNSQSNFLAAFGLCHKSQVSQMSREPNQRRTRKRKRTSHDSSATSLSHLFPMQQIQV